jgi:PAS domain S-box-containing protein
MPDFAVQRKRPNTTSTRGELRMASSLVKSLQDTEVSLKMLKVLTENSYDSILITDAIDGAKIIYVNKAFKKLTGYDSHEVLGKTPRILQGPATDKKEIARLAEALKKDGRFEGTAINYRKDGTPFIMRWRVLPLSVGTQTKFWVAIQREGSAV